MIPKKISVAMKWFVVGLYSHITIATLKTVKLSLYVSEHNYELHMKSLTSINDETCTLEKFPIDFKVFTIEVPFTK